jgi:hypothetical protein
MSLFRRVTRYRVGAAQNPRENRLTEVTAAVLESVDGFAEDALLELLEGIDDDDAAAASVGPILDVVRALEAPRLTVATQVTTQTGKFVDLQLRFRPQPFRDRRGHLGVGGD